MPFSTGQRLQPKEPENGGQKAVDAVETEASAFQVAWYGGRWAFWNPGDFQLCLLPTQPIPLELLFS